ncbi:MAG: ABC transporter permease subunit [Caldilineaceae bacterium]
MVTLLIAIPIGILSALRQYSIFDHVATFLAFVGQAIPFSGSPHSHHRLQRLAQQSGVSPSTGFAFSNFTNCADCKPLLPGGGMAPFGVDNPTFWQRLQHMILPVTMLALFGAGTYTRHMRGQIWKSSISTTCARPGPRASPKAGWSPATR